MNNRANLKNTFWEFSASLAILLRWPFCPDNLRYGLQRPPRIMAKYLKIPLKLIFEMGSSPIVIASIVLFMLACDSDKKGSTAIPVADSVEVIALKRETVSKSFSLPGQLLPWERAELYAKVQGYVRELKVDIGDAVEKNDILVILDAPEVAADYAKSSADLQAAQSKYHTTRDLYKRTVSAASEKGAVSESELERSKNQMLSDSASFEAARSGARAYAQLKNYLVIRAAFNGVVTQRNIDVGTLVGRDQTPMLVLENLNKLRLRVAVPEAYTSAIPESESISFTVDAQPSKKYKATLARKSNQIDEKTRTELWEFEVSNGVKELKSGMYGNVVLNLNRSEPTFVVPNSAVVTTQERRFVIRVREHKTEWVDVRNGISTNDKMEIFGNLEENDLLLVRPSDEIREGEVVVVSRP
jgi:membrane fusion protein (multidrug efflux system)